MSVDSFHTKKDRIYQLSSNNPFGDVAGGIGSSGRIMFQVRPTLEYLTTNYPEIENACQVFDVARSEIDTGAEPIPLNLISADTSFFSMFDFPVIAGSKKGLTPDGIMISAEKARQLFGTTDVVGKAVDVIADTTRTLTITAVFDKAPEKSHMHFNAVMGRAPFEIGKSSRNKPGGMLYVLLKDKTNPVDFMVKYNQDSLRPTLLGEGNMTYDLHPLKEAYFNPANTMLFMQRRSETFIWVGWIVCGLIQFMASFNFVNLFLLSIQERKKEIGIQKTLGISLWQTMRAAASEAGIYISLSFVSSLIFAYSITPVFNTALQSEINISYLLNFKVLGIILSIVVALALLVIILTTINQRKTLPVSMMRNISAKARYSKLFFTVQFFVSITLCVCTVTLIKQMKFLETESLGFNKNIMQLNAPQKESADKLAALKNSVSEMTGVEHVTQSKGNPISGNMIVYYTLEDKSTFAPYIFSGDENFIQTLNLQLIEGRFNTSDPNEKLVNETLVKKFSMKNPIGMIIPGSKTQRISGVVKDFTCSSFKQEIPPVIISYDAKATSLLIDYGHNDIDDLLPKIKSAWTKIFPDKYFDYNVIQQDLMKKYSEESLFYKIVLSASITSMIISCFGMFALSWAVIRSRAKEMGIRKVLGASMTDVLGLLTASFAKRLLLAFALAAPAGYYVMNLWLSRFVYKAPIDSWVFVFTGLALTFIAAITLGFQTIKASLSSPLDEIKE